VNDLSPVRGVWRSDRIAALALLLLAAGTAWQSLRLPLGSVAEPGAAAWPLLLSLLLGLLSVAIFAAAGQSPLLRALRWDERRHAVCILIAAGFAAAALETLGFRLTTFVMLLFLIGVAERRPVIPTVLVSLGLSFGTYHVFSHWLKVPLPVGLFGL
jgi:putative tricarboxylic transport membrane protein